MPGFIISLISIVLVGILSAVSMMYLDGHSVSKYGDASRSTGILIEAQHIAGASKVYYVDKGLAPSTVSDLINNNYLQADIANSKFAPAGSNQWQITGDYAYIGLQDESMCRDVNKKLGVIDPSTGEGLLPGCSSLPTNAPDAVCCTPDSI